MARFLGLVRWFDGKKTVIGSGLLLIAVVVSGLAGIWIDGDSPAWIEKLVLTLNWIGGMLTGVGLTHKGVKTVVPSSKSVYTKPVDSGLDHPGERGNSLWALVLTIAVIYALFCFGVFYFSWSLR